MTSPIITVGTAETAKELTAAICTLYDAVFSQPPFHWTNTESAHHRQSLVEMMADPTFGIVTAEATGGLAGFAYGVRLSPQTGWWWSFEKPLPSELTVEWEGRTFALIDVAVDERYRGQGIGRQLVDTLLGSRSEERATLCVQPIATKTQAIYRHLGWQYVGRREASTYAVSPYWDVYVLSLRNKP